MPRRTDIEYLATCDQLRHAWTTDQHPFSYLSAEQQWDLHAYYRPDEDLTSAELLAHRRAISKKQRALPQRAGRAWSAFLDGLVTTVRVNQQRVAQTGLKRRRSKVRHVSVRAVMRPKPDVERIAQALVNIALEQARSEFETIARADGNAGSDEVSPDDTGVTAKRRPKRR